MAPGEDVLKDGHVGVQGDVLERSCDASFRGQVGLEAHEELALPPDVALLGLVDLVDRIEQRSLTGAVGPDDGEQLIVVNVERDTVDSLDPLEEEMDVRDLEEMVVVLGSGPFGTTLEWLPAHDSHRFLRL